ncbi:hypothetical protein [Sedimenticola thiotaurini]|uniref:hypothetical protein n=1 Tax=Sedimenticola thiotaurini TaxID=1543721 RepID=UPI00190036F1|nr:hypothetical protein [Sedimenticola thiotaurini]
MSVNWHTHRLLTALFVASLVSGLASCGAGPQKRGERPQQPPPEAIAACEELSEGDACSFTGPRNDEVKGICTVLKSDQETLACAPEGGPSGKGGRRRR